MLIIPTDDEIIALILQHEGGKFTNDPRDAGGPTKWGITQSVLSIWRGYACTPKDVADLGRVEAIAIYLSNYLRPFDGLPDPLRVNAIDFGVNAGVERAAIVLQEIIGVKVDGKIGRETKSAAVVRDWNPLFTGGRLAFYEHLIEIKPKNLVWRPGWRARTLSFYNVSTRELRSMMRTKIRGDKPLYGHMGKAS